MRILVVSDTHGSTGLLLEAVRHAGSTDMLLHLGDGQRDCSVLDEYYSGEIRTVRGNCDFSSDDNFEQTLALQGSSIFMTHGHMYDAKMSLNRLWQKGRDINVDVVCFGHTHLPILVKQGKLTLMNPGSLRHTRSYGLITIIRDKEPEIRICKLR